MSTSSTKSAPKSRRFALDRLSLTMLAFAALLGCGEPELLGPTPQAVHGSVVYQGKPASGFRVTFHPQFDLGERQFAPSAMTDAEGKFTLTSYKAGDGAPAGKYAVTIEWPQAVNTGDEYDAQPTVDRLKGRFVDPAKSAWNVDVVAGENRLEPFQIH
jgi:hypothetical protein